jgi:hypothetical protein
MEIIEAQSMFSYKVILQQRCYMLDFNIVLTIVNYI